MLKRTDANFEKFGEIYFSFIYPSIVKAWHYHKQMGLNYAVPIGMIKLVLFDDREESSTKGEINEFVIGEHNYNLVHVPPCIWNGFKCIGPKTAIVANCATIPHDPDEIIRMDPFSDKIDYSWETKMR
jgi:dTDP-4-dehydrorhamnose 3,5-epimerase